MATPPAEAPPETVETPPPALPEIDDSATARINLRLPEQLKASVEQAASRERQSVNAWLVRAVAGALVREDRDRRPRGGRIGQRYTGWAR